MTAEEVSFEVAGVPVAGRHHAGRGDAFDGAAGRPCVVMAHGLGGTVDSGVDGFAESLAAGGLDALAFDYRGFGASGGEPRQVISIAGQRADYRAAVTHARGLPGVDPRRIVLWGCSFAGGHVFQLAAEDAEIAAVIALTPAPDGLASFMALVRRDGVMSALRLTAFGLRDATAAARGQAPALAALTGPPGAVAALTAPGALEGYAAIAGPTWRNEVGGRIFLQIGSYRPIRGAASVSCPTLVQIADADTTAPPLAAMRAAERARAEVRHYPCDHFDVYPGARWFDSACRHQLDFLARHLQAA